MPAPPVTYNNVTVPFAEMNRDGGSPRIHVSRNGMEVERDFLVEWADLPTFCYQALGYSFVSAGKLRRVLPLSDPDFPWLSATDVSDGKGLGLPNPGLVDDGSSKRIITASPAQSVAVYKKAKVTVRFMHLDYDLATDATIDADPMGEFSRFVEWDGDPSADYLTVPGSTNPLKWAEGPNAGTSIPDSTGRIVSGTTFTYTWRQIPYNNLPFTTIENTVGRVNKTTFANCDPHTLLMLNHKFIRTKTPFGDRAWDVVYYIKRFTLGHNKILDWKSTNWAYRQVSVDGTAYTPGSVPDGKLIFDEREFKDLFKVSP